MKKKVIAMVVVLSLVFPTICLGAEFYFFGMNGKWIKKANWWHVILGAVASPAIHELGHFIAMEATNTPYDWKITTFNFYTDDDSDARLIARSGFIAQHGVNLLLTSFKKTKQSDFTKGYTASSAILHFTYPWRRGHDLDALDDRAKGSVDKGATTWMFFNGITLHNILRIEW